MGMMGKVINVASLKLCKELYKLSGWKPNSENFYGDHGKLNEPIYDDFDRDVYAPAYDQNYLMQKLPVGTHLIKKAEGYAVSMAANTHTKYTPYYESADTAENALAKACISSIGNGIIGI